MKQYNIERIITGMAILIFAMIIAIVSQSEVAYIVGGLGLFFVILGCFTENKAN